MKPPTPSQENQNMAAMFKHMAEFGGGPASPIQMDLGKAENGEPFVFFTVGFTKREKIAAMMMTGMAGEAAIPTIVADRAVELADALLERLKK